MGRAVEKKILEIHYYNPIDEVPASKRVDGRQYGGGPGMVLKAEPYLQCFEKVKQYRGTRKIIFLTPCGTLFTQNKAKEYAQYENLVFFCGHYEGVDERVAKATGAEHASVGAYTLTGGELPAMSMVDAITREKSGVLGNENSREDARIAGSKVYTRPESLKYDGKVYSVPKILLSGHHKNIEAYRKSAIDK